MEDNQKLEQELHEAEHVTEDLLEGSAKKEDLSKLRAAASATSDQRDGPR